MGSEYIFFDEALRDRFVQFVAQRALACRTRPDTMVRLPADIARPLLENFSPGQIHALVLAIAHSLEHPPDGPLCCGPS